MKRLVFLAAAIVCLGRASLATSLCGNGNLAGYIALGSSGCLIGNNLLYDFQVLSGTAGATPIAPNGITITTLGGNSNPGITAQTKTTAGAGIELEAIFTYRIAGNYFTGSAITLANSSETPDGAVTDVQNFCAGGNFGPDGVSGCTGVPGSLVTDDAVQNQDSSVLGPSAFLSVTDDLTLDGGLAGSASGGTITDRFTAVPEPFTFLLTVVGLALALGLKLRSVGAGLFTK